jgi:ABC-type bacteriocin/lantibiotic exporter with double-glycine peptidase domain
MKNYNLIPQEKNTYCVCSVLQAIFDKHDVKISQEEIAKNLTPSDKGFYTDDEKMMMLLKQNGLEYKFFNYNATPFNEPDTMIKEIKEKEGIIGVKNHVYLLGEFEDPYLILIDPSNLSKKKENLSNLMKNMRESGSGFFGLIKKLD